MHTKIPSGLLAVSCAAWMSPSFASFAAEPPPQYYWRQHAIAADMSLIVEPPKELRTLKITLRPVFAVPSEVSAVEFRTMRIDVGPLYLKPSTKPEEKRA
jgi:hypothetical protein